jgi:hypothetical protein
MEVGSNSTGVCASVAKSTLDISNFLMEVALNNSEGRIARPGGRARETRIRLGFTFSHLWRRDSSEKRILASVGFDTAEEHRLLN